MGGGLANYIIENKGRVVGRKFELIGLVLKNDTVLNKFNDSSGYPGIYLESRQIQIKQIGESELPGGKFEGIKIDTSSINSKSNDVKCDKFALLYSGGGIDRFAYQRYYNDIEFMYQTLKYRYGFSDENIVVVYKDGFTINNTMPIDFAATRFGLDNALFFLDNKMGANRSLFLFVTNHGGGYNVKASELQGGLNDSSTDEIDEFKIDETFYYYDDDPIRISDDLFTEKIASLKLHTLVSVFQTCFGGGFIRDLRTTNRSLLSASSEFELSFMSTRNEFFDEFSYLFTSALNGAFHDRTPVKDVDLNNDGIISIFEAYTFALLNDKRDEHPMLDDNGDGISDDQDGSYSKGLSLSSCENFRIDKMHR